MKYWDCECGRLSFTELSVQFPTCPPTSSLSLMPLLFTLNAETPWAGKCVESKAAAAHKHTSVAFINFRHLRTDEPANKYSSNPLASQQKRKI